MRITFSKTISLKDSMVFEACYESELQLSFDEKCELLGDDSIVGWMFVDGELAGETYGIPLDSLDEEIEDCGSESSESIYCYSTTLLGKFQGLGLGRILKAFFIGMCFPKAIVGHSTTSAIYRINEDFGAVHSVRHENWYGTGRTAYFYRLEFK